MRKTSIHMSRREREEQLKGFVALCFASLEGQKTSDIAKNAGVCEATVYRLSNGEVSLFTRVGTIQGLGLADEFVVEASPAITALVRVVCLLGYLTGYQARVDNPTR